MAEDDGAGAARATLRITGRVQGVFFRANTRERAQELGLTGWVRNRADGSVEAVVEGPRDDVEQLVRWAHDGPARARVESVDVAWSEATDEFRAFQVER